jgi:hypothetical protein
MNMEERTRTYITNLREYFSTYHHHKEQMAFSAAALYLTGITALVIQPDIIWARIFHPAVTIIFVIIFSLLAIGFVSWQLIMRSFAADIVSACDDLTTKWLVAFNVNLNLEQTNYRGRKMPQFLEDELESQHRINKRWLPNTITIASMIIWSILLILRIGFIP